MATTLYYDRGTFAPTPSFTPVVQGVWDSDFSITVNLAPDTHASLTPVGFLTRSVNTNTSAATIVHCIAYSPPMQTTHLWSTALSCNWVARISEEFTTQNCFTLWNIGVCNNDGSIIRWQTSNMKDASEASTTLSSRNNAGSYSAGTYTNVPGDRIFVELGWDKDGAVSGSIALSYGYSTTAGNLSTTDGDTGIQNPWISIGHDVIFDPEGTTYSSSTDSNQLMMMGIGT